MVWPSFLLPAVVATVQAAKMAVLFFSFLRPGQRPGLGLLTPGHQAPVLTRA